MRNHTENNTELLEKLVTAWFPISADRQNITPKTKLVTMGLLAIAEQLKLLRDDLQASADRENQSKPQGGAQ